MRTAFAQCLLGVMLCAGISLQTHADYAEERSALASSIREIIEQGITSVLIYERDTETPVEEGQMTAQYLARDLYGGVGVSMPIHPANSLQLRSYTATGGTVYHHDADKLNLSTSTLHDLQDWRFVLDAATAAGIELSTYKVADNRTAGAIFNAFAGPPEENAQLPVGWDLSEAIDWADILAASRSLANSYIQGGHSLLGVALHNPQCQLGESILAPDIPGALLELALLAVPLDKAVKDVAEFSADVMEKVNSGDARPDLMDLVKLGAKIFWDESIGSLIAIGSHVLAADIIVAGSTNDAVLDFGALGIRMSQAQFQALRLSNLASTLSAPFYIDSYAHQESESKHQELMLSAQAAYMAEVISYCDENIRLNQEFPTGYQGAAEYLRGPVRPNHEPMIQNISGFAMNRGACGSCDIHVMDVDGDAIDVYLQGNSPGELRRIDDLSGPGLFVAEYIFCDLDSDSSNVFQVVLSATDNRSSFVEETFTVVVMNVPPCFMSETGCESRGGISFDGMVLSKGPSMFTMDPAWFEAGCLQFRDLDGDALTFRMTQFPRWGTANLMTSGSNGNYFVTVMYEIDREAMLSCHRDRRDLVDQLTVQATDPYGDRAEATMTIRFDVVNSPPVCENDSAVTPSGVPVTINVLANDSDPDEDALTVAEVATPAGGGASVVGNDIVYTPHLGVCGIDTFSYVADDGYEGQTTGWISVEVTDNVNPVAICQPATLYLDETGSATLDPAFLNDGSTDNCSIASFSASQKNFACNEVGDVPVLFTVFDGAGNSDTCWTTVTVVDAINPVAVGGDLTVQLDASGQVTVLATQLDNGSTDNCGIVSWLIQGAPSATFTCAHRGINLVAFTVIDPSGNSDSVKVSVTVEDVLPPTARCQNITASLDANAQVTIAASAVDGGSSDNCGIASMILDRDTFTEADIGDQTVTLTVTDTSGNTSMCTAIVTVQDNTPPLIVCPANVDVDADPGQCYATGVNLGAPTATDNTQVDWATLDNNAPAQFPVGTTNVTWSVDDIYGNTGSCTQQVRVTESVNPMVTCPGDIIVYTHNDAGIAVSFSATASDNCDPNPAISFSHSSGTTFPVGPTTVTCTATDSSGNTDACTFTVTVIFQNDPPVANDDSGTVPEGGGCIVINVLGNDSDPDMDALSVWSVSSPQCGTTAIINNATQVRYCTEGCVDPPDEMPFTYTITDGHNGFDSATVTVEMPDGPILFVVPPPDPE